jgi:hypothetical protein
VLASTLAHEQNDVVPTGYNLLDYLQSIGISLRAIKLTAYGMRGLDLPPFFPYTKYEMCWFTNDSISHFPFSPLSQEV